MPKKGKKGKGKGKKGKKGKKGDKKTKTLSDGALLKSMSEANSLMWEARLDVAEKSRLQYRDTSRRLLLQNDQLQTQVQQTEKDTIEVVTYLKRKDEDKDRQIEELGEQIKEVKKEHRIESEKLIGDFQQQISELEERLSQKTHETDILQKELKLVKEFRKRRAQMQKDLDEIKEAMLEANKEHKGTLARMDQKFFEEKMRLQQEANKKIAELAEKAHAEAIANLDETTRCVYKNNVRVKEALNFHVSEGETLKRVKAELEANNKILAEDKEMDKMMIEQKVSQTHRQKQLIKQLQDKVLTLEQTLSHVLCEFEREAESVKQRHKDETAQTTTQLSNLERRLILKTREMLKVKHLAKNILEQRTDMERFFLEALAHVKSEITANREQYMHDARLAYENRMLQACAGNAEYPKVRTFNKSTHSTNSVFHDLEAAQKLAETSCVDIADLTWEQRERVLRYLFARMNKGSTCHPNVIREEGLAYDYEVPLRVSARNQLSKLTADDEQAGDTFLTESRLDEDGVIMATQQQMQKLPQITTN